MARTYRRVIDLQPKRMFIMHSVPVNCIDHNGDITCNMSYEWRNIGEVDNEHVSVISPKRHDSFAIAQYCPIKFI